MSGPILLGLRFLLALSLYAFLTWAFITLWQDVRQQGELLAARKVPPLNLTIQSGDLLPQTKYFTQAEITIGRDPACECPLTDEAVSARHARLSHHHGQWWLEDLNSTNGTLLNRERLSTPTVVISGDEFRCGGTTLTISLTSGAATSPTQPISGKQNE